MELIACIHTPSLTTVLFTKRQPRSFWNLQDPSGTFWELSWLIVRPNTKLWFLEKFIAHNSCDIFMILNM